MFNVEVSVTTSVVEAKAPKGTVEKAVVQPIDIGTFEITLVGDSPLIVHAWAAKTKIEMLESMQRKTKVKGSRPVRNPEQEYKDSLYPLPGGGYGFPSIGVKGAAVSACRSVAGVAMTEARGTFHINGEFVRIKGEPTMREDMVKVGMGSADLRYRAEFKEWSMTFQVRYNRSMLTAEQIINLFNIAGFGNGIGEWRPQRNGAFGMFHVQV
jgi:hypothetical protein